VNLAKREGIPDRDNNGWASLAEAASLQLEMKYLSHLTGDMVYWRKAEKVGISLIVPAQPGSSPLPSERFAA
jgi:hypothetical protein